MHEGAAMSSTRGMTYGDANCVMILSGQALGLEVGMAAEATRHLNGSPIHPMTGAAIEAEAVRLNARVRGDAELLRAANSHAERLKAEFGFGRRVDQ